MLKNHNLTLEPREAPLKPSPTRTLDPTATSNSPRYLNTDRGHIRLFKDLTRPYKTFNCEILIKPHKTLVNPIKTLQRIIEDSLSKTINHLDPERRCRWPSRDTQGTMPRTRPQ